MADTENKLWYEKPAKTWIQGMPLGNGRLGAMLQGKLRTETIFLNDDTVWAKGRTDRNNKDSYKYLPEVRRLLAEGQVERAQALAEISMIGTPKKQSPYQPLGELNLIFSNHCDDSIEAFRSSTILSSAQSVYQTRVSKYRRVLDYENAIATISYTLEGTNYNREFFISQPDNVLAVRLTSSHKCKLSVCISLFRRFDVVVSVPNKNTIEFEGQCGKNGVKFHTLLDVNLVGGTSTAVGESLYIENADEIILYLVSETDYRSADYMQVCHERMNKLKTRSYEEIKTRHIQEYRSYFNRVQFSMETDGEYVTLPTDERLKRVKTGKSDLGLIAQYFNYGRYLLISSSRPDSLPANLQGIWCNSMIPEWDSKYTININTQMNYWPAEICNLSECHTPLFELLDGMRQNGRITAQKMYGCRGFTAHHNTDLWHDTAPLDHTRAGLWPMGAAWLCYHLWQHYLYSQDNIFLEKQVYPILKEAVEFFLDYLMESKNGFLISGPSLSPENRYVTHDKQIGCLCMSPAMDTQIISGLFLRFLSAAELLGIENDVAKQVKISLKKLPPMKISVNGQLQEWMEDYEELEPGHRHISHLFGVYPDNQINAEDTPELFAAARKSLEKRIKSGSGSTGWSEAWITALWARFGDGNNANISIQKLLQELTSDSLLDVHPPETFQIDGNLGATAAIAEMFLQCRNETLYLFPALPDCWKGGKMTGLRAIDNLTVDLYWQESREAKVVLYAGNDVCKTILTGNTKKLIASKLTLKAGETHEFTFML